MLPVVFNTQSPVYANLDDLDACGVPPEALRDIGPIERQRALYQASRTVDQRISSRYPLPLVSIGDDTKQMVCLIAAFRLLNYAGWNPSNPANGGIVKMYDEAMKTLDLVARGDYTLDVVGTSPEPLAVPEMMSHRQRGIGRGGL